MILSFIVLFLSKDVRSTGQFSDPYIVAVLVSLISGIVYAGSLIVSKAGERSWLKLGFFVTFGESL
jgi:hypothetical protein